LFIPHSQQLILLFLLSSWPVSSRSTRSLPTQQHLLRRPANYHVDFPSNQIQCQRQPPSRMELGLYIKGLGRPQTRDREAVPR